MSFTLETSYFYALPNEVLLEILKMVDTVSVIKFCEVYGCDYFLEDKNIIRTINLNKQYTFNDLNVLSRKIELTHVKTLNINCVYWIPAGQLRKFVTKLVNLETLYAIHTTLSLTAADTEAFQKLKIKKLGVTVDSNVDMGFHRLETVETLYVNFFKMAQTITLVVFKRTFPSVTKFWVSVEHSSIRQIIFYSFCNEYTEKIFWQLSAAVPTINFHHYGLKTYYSNRRYCQSYGMCSEKIIEQEARNDVKIIEDSWRVLDELHCPKPYGPKDALKLYLKKNSLDDIYFEELNLVHAELTCNERCNEALRQILRAKNATAIKKLSIMTCLLQNPDKQGSVPESNGFKRKRIGISNASDAQSVEDMFRNVGGLQELEITICQQASCQGVISAFPFISNFEKLRSLYVNLPIISDGSFLLKVLQKCKCLERLIVSSPSQNEKLNFNLLNALEFAESLRDLRFDNYNIPLDKLLERLCSIQSKRLERLVFSCTRIDRFSAAPLKGFLTGHPQLTFLYFLIKECPEVALKMAQSTLNIFKKQHPAKVFLVKRVQDSDEENFRIPKVHLCEMVELKSKVADLCALRDFESF